MNEQAIGQINQWTYDKINQQLKIINDPINKKFKKHNLNQFNVTSLTKTNLRKHLNHWLLKAMNQLINYI